MKITKWADLIGAQINIYYAPNSSKKQPWTAHINYGELRDVKEETKLYPASADGSTPNEALANLVDEIRSRNIIVRYYGSRKSVVEFIVPDDLEA